MLALLLRRTALLDTIKIIFIRHVLKRNEQKATTAINQNSSSFFILCIFVHHTPRHKNRLS